ncbi:MAG: hypothetical protein R3324_20955, partial [Halobacteriales archaeon]|nr:hypothetical protein [Halobacteriales archaeon]
MATTVLIAVILGCFAGLAPGPYTTMVAATAVERGFRAALRLAFTPLVTDSPPLVLTSLLLERLDPAALAGIGVVGGAIVIAIGVRFLKPQLGQLGGTVNVSPNHIIIGGWAIGVGG